MTQVSFLGLSAARAGRSLCRNSRKVSEAFPGRRLLQSDSLLQEGAMQGQPDCEPQALCQQALPDHTKTLQGRL